MKLTLASRAGLESRTEGGLEFREACVEIAAGTAEHVEAVERLSASGSAPSALGQEGKRCPTYSSSRS
jgi:hypothetical protein